MAAKLLSRDEIARRVGRDIPDGAYVNLGIGLPTLAANYVPTDREVIYHSENGILGMGPAPKSGNEDPDIINASKKPVTLLPGASIFHHTDAFAMIPVDISTSLCLERCSWCQRRSCQLVDGDEKPSSGRWRHGSWRRRCECLGVNGAHLQGRRAEDP
jgi:hypothetical protein